MAAAVKLVVAAAAAVAAAVATVGDVAIALAEMVDEGAAAAVQAAVGPAAEQGRPAWVSCFVILRYPSTTLPLSSDGVDRGATAVVAATAAMVPAALTAITVKIPADAAVLAGEVVTVDAVRQLEVVLPMHSGGSPMGRYDERAMPMIRWARTELVVQRVIAMQIVQQAVVQAPVKPVSTRM